MAVSICLACFDIRYPQSARARPVLTPFLDGGKRAPDGDSVRSTPRSFVPCECLGCAGCSSRGAFHQGPC
jgi:hypothetical protein